MKFVDWVQLWFILYKEPFLKDSSLSTVRYCLNHIVPYFDNKDLSDISGADLQTFLFSLSDVPNMQDKCRKCLLDIFKYAYYNRHISFDPTLAIKMKSYRFDPTPVMNAEVRSKFVYSLSGKPYEVLYLAYLFTGARRAELITPGSFEVDFEHNFCFIHGTKTLGSDRVVPLFDFLRDKLLALPDYKTYFTSYKPNWVYLCLHRHLKSIGLSEYCVRSLRSSFALMCYECGVRDTTISAWLGHSSPRTTNTFYLNNTEIALSQLSAVKSEIDNVNWGAL